MEVIILAGGLGTRLRSVVSEVPKCMAPVAGKPFLWYLLKYLTRYDVSKVILSVGYLRGVIFDWVEEMKDDFPFHFDYAIEEEPLGTGGGIRLALNKATTSDVVVLNGDTYFDVNLEELMKNHRLYSSAVTLALKPMCDFDRYGRVVLTIWISGLWSSRKRNTARKALSIEAYMSSTGSNPFLKDCLRGSHLRQQSLSHNASWENSLELCRMDTSLILVSQRIIRKHKKNYLAKYD